MATKVKEVLIWVGFGVFTIGLFIPFFKCMEGHKRWIDSMHKPVTVEQQEKKSLQYELAMDLMKEFGDVATYEYDEESETHIIDMDLGAWATKLGIDLDK